MLKIFKNTLTEIKNTIDGLVNILNIAEERISKLDKMFTQTFKTETQREKRI